MAWKRINDNNSYYHNDNNYNYEQNYKRITDTRVQMPIYHLSNRNAGTYGCYVWSSTGTMRQIVDIIENSDGKYEVNVRVPTKQIQLSIEKFQDRGQGFDKYLKIGSSYQFDCISGELT
jgi:hypothetical protein